MAGRMRDMFRLMRSKDEVRAEVWKAMEDQGVSRFPGAEGRIPNFAGRSWRRRSWPPTGSGNGRWWSRPTPIQPQTHARRLALEEGKTVIMAVPRLRDPHPFRVLDPKKLRRKRSRTRRRSRGPSSTAACRPRRLTGDRLRPLRLGRRQPQRRPGRQRRRLPRPRVRDPRRRGKIDTHITVATTVHPIQILRQHLLVTDHDLPAT